MSDGRRGPEGGRPARGGDRRGARRGVFGRWAQIFQFRSTPRYIHREIDAEIDFHLERRVAALIEEGLSRAEAECEAQRRFGNLGRHRKNLEHIDRKRDARERRGASLDVLRQDVRYAARGLAQSRGFTAAVVITLALGIGANATMFGVIDRLLLSPPAGVRDPVRVRRLFVTRGFDRGSPFTSATLTYTDITDWRAAEGFDVAAFADRSITVGRGDSAYRTTITYASANFFELLGVQPRHGRFFTDHEDRTRAPVIVIADSFWQEEFDRDPDVLGRSVEMGETMLEVIGVAPRLFHGINLSRVDGWVPLRTPASAEDPESWEPHRNWYWLRAVARLRPGVGPERAAEEATALHRAARADTEYDREAFVTAAHLVTARGPRASDESLVAKWLSGVSAAVLLIACANVANLLLARATRRRREIAVRLAIGVSRGRLIRQLVTESLMLAGLAGAAALVVAYWGAGIMRGVLLPDVHWPTSPIDPAVLAFTLVTALTSGLVAGIVPALQASRPNLVDVLKAGERSATSRRSRTRTILLVAQAALSVLLLLGAGLFVRSLQEVEGLDLGLDPERVLVVFPDIAAGTMDDVETARFYRRAIERLETLPGVASVAASASAPFLTSWGERVTVPGVPELPDLRGGGPYTVAATPKIFETLDLRIVEGRGFLPHEDEATAPVAVIDELMARLVWPHESALGKCLLIGYEEPPPCSEIVGVVENSRRQEIVEAEAMQYFVPLGQGVPTTPHVLFVRAEPDRFAGLIPEVRSRLQAMTGAVRYVTVRPYVDYVDPQTRSWRLGATMFTVFGGLALAIASIGLYGVLAFSVVQRTRELGVRTALGATPRRLVGMVLRQALLLTLAGVAVGTAAALAGGRWISSLLFNVSPRDPLVFLSVGLILVSVAAVAAVFPAWRVTQVDPNLALRNE